jgi:lysozyme family protein
LIEALIDRLIVREGGYVNHPADRGGPTNYGITLQTLSSYLGMDASVDDVVNLRRSDAVEIYYAMYWGKPGFDTLTLPDLIVEMIFDAGVHHGPGRAVKILQTAVVSTRDGHLGPKTLLAATLLKPKRLAAKFVAARVAFFGRLITKDPGQSVFAAGWLNRVGEFINMIPEVS